MPPIRRAWGLVFLILLLPACSSVGRSSENEVRQVEPVHEAPSFALQVGVTGRESEGWRPLASAQIAISGTTGKQVQSGFTDERGIFGPVSLAWDKGSTEPPVFPYSMEVSSPGHKTCVVTYGGLVLPETPRWWESSVAQPLRIFVALPSGSGVSPEEDCYAGRGRPQTPGAEKP